MYFVDFSNCSLAGLNRKHEVKTKNDCALYISNSPLDQSKNKKRKQYRSNVHISHCRRMFKSGIKLSSNHEHANEVLLTSNQKCEPL